MKNLRIIPLLVFVAMLSFSVRLVDVVTGVSSLSGSAYAESKKDSKDTNSDNAFNDGGFVFSNDEEVKEEVKEKIIPIDEDEPVDLQKWRDFTDEDPRYSSVRTELFNEMATRRKKLDVREKGIVIREALMKAAGQELDHKYQELSQLRQKIENLLQKQSEEELARIKSLVKIYEGMKPKDAARIFDTLDIDVLISVMSFMSERKLSPILAAMNPERARTITIMLAEQKQLPILPYAN
ncbi:MAG: MotE family protein [Alphaproteobacteria bacterium]|nr:MotE family protein [Alphaproteobacteria bacterium]